MQVWQEKTMVATLESPQVACQTQCLWNRSRTDVKTLDMRPLSNDRHTDVRGDVRSEVCVLAPHRFLNTHCTANDDANGDVNTVR